MQNKMTGNEYRTTIVCVDSYEDDVLRGRLYNPFLPDGSAFCSVMQFLLQMESLLDEMRFPQSFTAKREFTPGELSPAPAVNESLRGGLATFAVRILFRQNASWQGSVTWLETQREESFRSALELLTLMHSAMLARGQEL